MPCALPGCTEEICAGKPARQWPTVEIPGVEKKSYCNKHGLRLSRLQSKEGPQAALQFAANGEANHEVEVQQQGVRDNCNLDQQAVRDGVPHSSPRFAVSCSHSDHALITH